VWGGQKEERAGKKKGGIGLDQEKECMGGVDILPRPGYPQKIERGLGEKDLAKTLRKPGERKKLLSGRQKGDLPIIRGNSSSRLKGKGWEIRAVQ